MLSHLSSKSRVHSPSVTVGWPVHDGGGCCVQWCQCTCGAECDTVWCFEVLRSCMATHASTRCTDSAPSKCVDGGDSDSFLTVGYRAPFQCILCFLNICSSITKYLCGCLSVKIIAMHSVSLTIMNTEYDFQGNWHIPMCSEKCRFYKNASFFATIAIFYFNNSSRGAVAALSQVVFWQWESQSPAMSKNQISLREEFLKLNSTRDGPRAVLWNILYVLQQRFLLDKRIHTPFDANLKAWKERNTGGLRPPFVQGPRSMWVHIQSAWCEYRVVWKGCDLMTL